MQSTVDVGSVIVPEGAREIIVAALVLAGVAVLMSLLAQGRGTHLILTLLGATPRRRLADLSQPLPRAERDWELVGRLDTAALKRRPLILRALAPVGRLIARAWAPIGAAIGRALAPVTARVRAAVLSLTRPVRVRLRAWRLKRAEARVVRAAERATRRDERQRAKQAAREERARQREADKVAADASGAGASDNDGERPADKKAAAAAAAAEAEADSEADGHEQKAAIAAVK